MVNKFSWRVKKGTHLDDESPKDDGAEDKVVEDSVKDVPLAMDLAGVYLVEELHHDERVKDNGVVLRGRGVERGVPAAIDVKDPLTCETQVVMRTTQFVEGEEKGSHYWTDYTEFWSEYVST